MPLYLPALVKWLSWVTGLKIGSNREQTYKKHQLLETYSQSWGKVSWGAALTVFVQTEAFLSPWNPSSCPQHRDNGRQSDLGRSSMAPGGCEAAEQETGSYPFPTLSILAEPFLSALACIILSLLLPLLIPVSCTRPLPWAREIHNEKLSSQQQTKGFIVCESWQAEEQSWYTYMCFCICSHTCMKYPRNVHSITSYCKLQVLVLAFSH